MKNKTVLVQHRSVSQGDKVMLKKTKGVVRYVKAFMEDGHIKDHVNEVWKVVPCKNGKADFETVA